jgi:hypothetical protein
MRQWFRGMGVAALLPGSTEYELEDIGNFGAFGAGGGQVASHPCWTA